MPAVLCSVKMYNISNCVVHNTSKSLLHDACVCTVCEGIRTMHKLVSLVKFVLLEITFAYPLSVEMPL